MWVKCCHIRYMVQRIVWIPFLMICFNLSAQQCGNCRSTPSVALYDLDVQVPQPALNGSDSSGWLEWLQLFWINKHLQSAIFNSNKNCIKFTQPNDAGLSKGSGEEQIIKVGITYTNLPSSGDLSRYGNYIYTGSITGSGYQYQLKIYIQASCSRKTIISIDHPFTISASSQNTIQIAQQVAAQLSTLGEKIEQFELNERKENKSLSLASASWGEPIKITPLKKTLKAGESTSFTIELKDCDGVPLSGRDILFSESSFAGFKIYGTMGGTVSPSKVTTDASGMAKATFTLKPGAKEAVINVHSPGKDVKGCESIFIGNAYINITRIYKGYVKYSFDQTDICNKENHSGVTSSISKWNISFKVDYTSMFHSKIEDESISNDGEGSGLIPDQMDGGSHTNQKTEIKRIQVASNEPVIQVITRNVSGELKDASLRFSFDMGNPYVEVNLNFLVQGSAMFRQTYLPGSTETINEYYQHSVAFFSTDPNMKYTKSETSEGIKHVISYLRSVNAECTQVIERLELQVVEQ